MFDERGMYAWDDGAALAAAETMDGDSLFARAAIEIPPGLCDAEDWSPDDGSEDGALAESPADLAATPQVLSQQLALWSSFQRRIAEFINTHSGAAAVENPTACRHDWDQVRGLYHRPVVTWL